MASNIPGRSILRITQVLFALVVFGLTAYIFVTYQFDDIAIFMFAVSIWSAFFATPYLSLAPVRFDHAAKHIVIPAVETLTTLLWLAAFIALATKLLPADQCNFAGCNASQVAVLFGSFEFALFTVTTVQSFLALRSGRPSTAPTKETQEV
ncbi:marvel domain-containing protein [Aspergillus taichungensis]|uniref:Marvel domain-containing protein n=1 Tax=Aspergillus taichungensis TaxID=482145 RepID=A0A2J5I4U4_9EURO|nr:marvel domain-containing protein [Aspergillus taichungensis]